jgi:hypothetical protein
MVKSDFDEQQLAILQNASSTRLSFLSNCMDASPGQNKLTSIEYRNYST